MLRKLIIITIIFGFLFPVLIMSTLARAVEAPRTLEEAKQAAKEAGEAVQEELPGVLRRIWEEKVLPIWQGMWDWFYVNVWSKIENWFRREIEPKIEERKPIIEQELEKEKEEIKQELPEAGKSLWERFKELIK